MIQQLSIEKPASKVSGQPTAFPQVEERRRAGESGLLGPGHRRRGCRRLVRILVAAALPRLRDTSKNWTRRRPRRPRRRRPSPWRSPAALPRPPSRTCPAMPCLSARPHFTPAPPAT